CELDTVYMVWMLASESHVLATDPAGILEANIFYPAHHARFYGDTGFGALPYFATAYGLTGNPALALNLTFLGCLVLSAFTLYVVVVRWTGSRLAGLVAGTSLLMNRWVLWDFIPTAPSYAVMVYFPLIVFLASRPARGWREVVPLVPLVALQCLTDVVY